MKGLETGPAVGPISSMREPALITQFVLCIIAALEGADNNLLGATTKTTSAQLAFTLNAFAEMAIAQGVMANLAAPIWGIIADRGLADQKMLLVVAALGQGFITILLSTVQQYGAYMIFLRALNGLFLAGLRPICNGIVAKTTSDDRRGKVFSRVQIFILLGGSVCSALVTPLQSATLFGYKEQGWRFAWAAVGALSVLVAFATIAFLKLPAQPDPDPNDKVMDILAMELRIFCTFLQQPTFCFMICQGIFGTIPWTVMWMNTLFYQLAGIPDFGTWKNAGNATALAPVFGMMGIWLGGFLADVASARFGLHGRPMIAQATVALGVPFLYYHYYGIDPVHGNFYIFVALNAGFGIFGNWAQAGCNWPVLSEIVVGDVQSRVMAMESAIENSLATILGPLFVAWLGKNVFNFELGQIGQSNRIGANAFLAQRLGSCLCLTVCIPFMCAFIIYSFLHYAFPFDMYRKRIAEGENPTPVRAGSQVGVQQYMYSRTNSTLHA